MGVEKKIDWEKMKARVERDLKEQVKAMKDPVPEAPESTPPVKRLVPPVRRMTHFHKSGGVLIYRLECGHSCPASAYNSTEEPCFECPPVEE